MSKKRTIGDIARLAGVSKATVSRVLNDKPDVDAETRQRILRIMQEEDFVPSITASGLARGHSRMIGALVPTFTWPFVPEIVKGVAEAIGTTTYEMVLYSVNERVSARGNGSVLDHILASNLVAGLLAIMPGQSFRHVMRLYESGFPVVLIDDQDIPPDVPWICANSRQGGYDAVCHLLEMGHRRIAHICGKPNRLCTRERYHGYCLALAEAGIPVDPSLVVEGDFEIDGGVRAAHQLFSLPLDQRPSAIFAGSDIMAYGVLKAAEQHHLHIPNDVSLVGFDDIPSASLMRPGLTTIRQPFAEMGQRATELLLNILNTPHAYAERYRSGYEETALHNSVGGYHAIHIQLPTSLVVRESCRSPALVQEELI